MGQCGATGHYAPESVGGRSIGRKKAVLCGINYRGTSAELRGCINDVINQRQIIIQQFGFNPIDILMLTEDENRSQWPYKKTIQDGLKWLYADAKAGDVILFHYSGHGSQYSQKGVQADCICPLDCVNGPWPQSVILDDEIHRDFYDPLPPNCKAIGIFDCCHSGTIANLPVKREMYPPHGAAHEPRARYLPQPGEAQVAMSQAAGLRKGVVSGNYGEHQLWVFSGCQDDQTSADAHEDGQYQGAFSWALFKSLQQDVWNETYIDLLEQIRENLKYRYRQIPALTTTQTAYLNWVYMGHARTIIDKSIPMDEVKPGRRKALLVGINYRQTQNELRGCINDVKAQNHTLLNYYGFHEDNIMILTEDEHRSKWPYKARIQEGWRWLLHGAQEGDMLVFHYSGHGSQMRDVTGTEPSGLSDCICPLDCNKSWPEHIILDTEIHKEVYDFLPDKVKLICLFDCCHSGTVANLNAKRGGLVPMVPEEYNGVRYFDPPACVAEPASPSTKSISGPSSPLSCIRPKAPMVDRKNASGFRRAVHGDHAYKDKLVWVYSGCQDNQTSADAYEDGTYQGAFSWAIQKCLREHRFSMRHGSLLHGIRNKLRGRYAQVPALSTTQQDYFSRFYMAQMDKLHVRSDNACIG